MEMSLYEVLQEVQDPRRGEGLRTNISQMFCMIIVSNLCGHFGGRGVARFAKENVAVFEKVLRLKHGVPSHVTFSEVLKRVDNKELIKAFNKWANDYVPLSSGTLLSGDGKALGATVQDKHGRQQNFEAVVSLFAHKSGLVYSLEQYQNGKESEIGVVQYLIGKLENMGVTLCLDALHAQKNG